MVSRMSDGMDCALRVLQVSSSDYRGGAARVAWNLFHAYRDRGCRSAMAVGQRQTNDPDIFTLNSRQGMWSRGAHRLESAVLRAPLAGLGGKLAAGVSLLAEPAKSLDRQRGVEDFHHPGIWHLLRQVPFRPDVIHLHNLHGGYFDLRALPWLSRRASLFLTLHDAWMLSGHCAHSFDCERWKTGCGDCPDLAIPPAILRDATAFNWRRKAEIYSRSRLYVAAPSRWLMERVEQSMLWPGVVEARVIPNGIDTSVFAPGDRAEARVRLGIPLDSLVFLFAANGIRRKIWKDYATLRSAVTRVADAVPDRRVLFVALGEDAPPEHVGQAVIQFVPHEDDPVRVAAYYRASDLYLHAARADTFPTTVLESLCCGIPVVATAVGGIVEQVKSLEAAAWTGGGSASRAFPATEATGALAPEGGAEEMASAILRLVERPELLARLGANAAADGRLRFSLSTQVDRYLSWYTEVVNHRERESAPYAPGYPAPSQP